MRTDEAPLGALFDDDGPAEAMPITVRPAAHSADPWVSGILLVLLGVPAVLLGLLFLSRSGSPGNSDDNAKVIALAISILACVVAGAWMWFRGAREHSTRRLWWGTTVAGLPMLGLVGWVLAQL